MRFVRYADRSDAVHLGVVDPSDPRRARPLPGHDDLLPLLAGGLDDLLEAGASATGDSVELADVRILPPIATPPTIRDFYAFEQHVAAGKAWRGETVDADWYELPVFYFTNPYAVLGDGDVPISPGCERFDYELEVAAVLGGAPARDLTPAEGEEKVVGYCIFNDWSARDIQGREMKQSLGPAKGKDGATGLGPYLVTKDELTDVRTATGYELTMTASVNGREYSRAQWSDVYWSFGEMVAYASRGTQVRAGDVIGSGTCGTGCILELHRTDPEAFPWLRPGDVVTTSIERLGTLTNTVVDGPALIPLRP